MDITRATILEANIDDDLSLKLIFAMTYLKNNCFMKALQNNLSLYKTYTYELPNLSTFKYLAQPFTYSYTKKNEL